MKKIILVLLSLVLVLSTIGCGKNGKDSEPISSDIKSSADDGQAESHAKKADQSLQPVPGTNLPIYPGSKQVYSDERTLTYATSDRAKDVQKFYEENAGATTFLTAPYSYFLGTDLYDLTKQDFEDRAERAEIIDQYFEDAGGKAVREFMIIEKEMAKAHMEDLFEDEGKSLQGKTLIIYEFIDYYYD